MLENITVVFPAENVIMIVNISEELTGFLTTSKQDVFFVAHLDCSTARIKLLRSVEYSDVFVI